MSSPEDFLKMDDKKIVVEGRLKGGKWGLGAVEMPQSLYFTTVLTLDDMQEELYRGKKGSRLSDHQM